MTMTITTTTTTTNTTNTTTQTTTNSWNVTGRLTILFSLPHLPDSSNLGVAIRVRTVAQSSPDDGGFDRQDVEDANRHLRRRRQLDLYSGDEGDAPIRIFF